MLAKKKTSLLQKQIMRVFDQQLIIKCYSLSIGPTHDFNACFNESLVF